MKDSKTLILYIGKKEYELNGKKLQMDTAALLQEGRTFVPARYVAEAFGGSVRWDSVIRTVYIDTNGSVVPTPQTTKDPVYGWIDVTKDETYVEYEVSITFTSDNEVMKLRSSTTSAAFNSGTDTRTITTKIYNGKSSIPAKTFEHKIDYNAVDYLQKNLFWTSEPYKFNVVRWMCHEDEDDSLYGWTAVLGRNQRTFI